MVLTEVEGDLKKAADILEMPLEELVEFMGELEIQEEDGVRDLGMQLEDLCTYEIARSERYGRCFSLLMVSSGNGPVNVRGVFGRAIRKSDASFMIEHGLAIVMGDTEIPGVVYAVDRFKRRYNGSVDLRYGVASYPRDRKDAGDLISKAEKRLSEAKSAEAGAVVYEG